MKTILSQQEDLKSIESNLSNARKIKKIRKKVKIEGLEDKLNARTKNKTLE